MEIFRDIKNYEGLYQVSNLGNVKSLARKGCLTEKIMRPAKDNRGYLILSLRNDGKAKSRTIHQLVAEAFLNHVPCGHKLVVNHKNFNRHDNRAENLEVDTQRNNANQKHLKSSSEYTGVSWAKDAGKWISSIYINGKNKHLGYFYLELEAAYAYQTELKRIT